jgi:exodeoxyribonuclease-3
MRVMTQNILFGGEGRFAALCEVLAAARPDVLVLQECLGWEDSVRLRELARALHIPEEERHVFLSHSNARASGKRYHLALLSRIPLRSIRVHTEGMAHSVFEARFAGAAEPGAERVLFGTHLVAANEDARLAETEVLLSHVAPSLARGAEVILAGDLNALSPGDPYPGDLDERFARLGIVKYGWPARFDVMQRLFAAGFVDALERRADGAPWVTAVRGRRDGGVDTGERVDTRTDYVLLSPALAPRLRGCGVVDVRDASDHHGVYADLDPHPLSPE